MHVQMDIVGSREASETQNQQFLAAARALGLSPEQAMKLARPANRVPRISRRIRSASNTTESSEISQAHMRLDRLKRNG